MKQDEMGGTRSMHGNTRNAYSILVGTLKIRNRLGETYLDERIILKLQ
jgi:hypothetical protein